MLQQIDHKVHFAGSRLCDASLLGTPLIASHSMEYLLRRLCKTKQQIE